MSEVVRESDLLSGWLAQTAESDRLAERFASLARAVPQGVAIVTPQRLVFASAACLDLVGMSAEALASAPLAQVVPDGEARRQLRSALERAWQGKRAETGPFAMAGGGGITRSVSVRVEPLPREVEPAALVVVEPAAAHAARPAPESGADSLRALGLHLAGLATDLRGTLAAYVECLTSLANRQDLPHDVRDSLAVYQAVTHEALDRLARGLDWGRPGPFTERIDLQTVVEAALEASSREGRSARIDIRAEMEPTPPVRGRGDQLRLAIDHILKNGVEALASKGGTMAISLRPAAGRAELVIRDDGPGIPASLLPHVFDPFSSTKSIASSHGLGLGLAIVRDVVTRHQGTVAIDSSPAGTAVTLSLPLAPARATAGDGPGPRRVLLVDDDPMVRETYEAILKTEGWSVLTASDAEEALQVVATEDPSAMLLDVQMAGRDGLAVVEALALWYPHMLPRVALHSGYSTEARVAAAAARHGLVVLQKPSNVIALTKALAEIADRSVRKPLAGLSAQPSRSTSPDVSL